VTPEANNTIQLAPPGVTVYRLNPNAVGYVELKDNIYNLGVISNDPNSLKAEYEAGFVQGKLQKGLLALSRDNAWDGVALNDVSHQKKIPPTDGQKKQAQDLMIINYNHTIEYAKNADPKVRTQISRILFRMLGVYHGATKDAPAALDFSGNWMPELGYFSADELRVNYETEPVSFMDVYFLNAYMDMFDVADDQGPQAADNPSKCSAFIKKTENGVFLAHNSWSTYLDQSMALTYYIHGDYIAVNTINPGAVTSLADFGYNNKGLMFLETTHHNTYSQPKADALWMYLRAALAEQFAGSIDEFYQLASLEPSGTYMNGYMVYDNKTGEMGLVEMSYKSFILFKSNANGSYDITSNPANLSKEYDHELVQPNVLLGVNFPASYAIRDELKAVENRPMRRVQFLARIGGVNDIESAKDLITYTDPNEPLSIYGRWDLGYGTTPSPKKVPDGSIDAKAMSASMMAYSRNLKGELDFGSPKQAFWMKYGTPIINGTPFIWSKSEWNGQKLRWVPDVVDGNYTLVKAYIK